MNELPIELALLLIILQLCSAKLTGQPEPVGCFNPSAGADLKANAIRARITNGGDLWWDGSRNYHRVAVSGDERVDSLNTIFAGGLWMAGRDSDANFKIAAQQYGRANNNFDYYTGPLGENGNHYGDCSDWDRMFPIYRTEIEEFFAAFDLTNPPIVSQVPLNIAGWPGVGNPHFEAIHGFSLPDNNLPLAPFYDQDGDGKYDPLAGDFPLFTGDQAIWCVFNDSGNTHRESNLPAKFQAEIQLLAYASASEDSVLNQTTYYEYKIFNRSSEQLMDFLVGHWLEVNLGCYDNDLVNSSPGHNLFYFYNGEAIEDSCSSGFTATGSLRPVTILQVVSAGDGSGCEQGDTLMQAFNLLHNPGPDTLLVGGQNTSYQNQVHNFMSGKWFDGTPLTRGGTGYEPDGGVTRYMYDGGDYNGEPWLQCNSASISGSSGPVYSTGPYNLAPGQAASFTLAVTNVFRVNYPEETCPDTLAIFRAADRVKAVHDSACVVLSNIGGIVTDPPGVVGREVFPNPSMGQLTVRVPNTTEISQIEIIDFSGRQLASYPGTGSELSFDLQAAGLSPGIYFYRIKTIDGEVATGRIVLTQ